MTHDEFLDYFRQAAPEFEWSLEPTFGGLKEILRGWNPACETTCCPYTAVHYHHTGVVYETEDVYEIPDQDRGLVEDVVDAADDNLYGPNTAGLRQSMLEIVGLAQSPDSKAQSGKGGRKEPR